MTYKNKIFNSLNVTRDARTHADVEENMLAELMANPDYLRHSSAVINEALKEGFDVLQLPNGDIVTTGTKTIVNTYVWDAQGARLDKARAPSEKPMRTRKSKKIEENAE
ncbi:MAG: DUF2671 domain-containing protein [Rickettsiales bacterium]